MTTYYNYNSETGEYTGSELADLSPLEPGVYLIPANATIIEPPQAEQNECAIFNGESWSLTPDFRGTKYWLDHDTELEVKEMGQAIPTGASLTQPDPAPKTPEETAAEYERLLDEYVDSVAHDFGYRNIDSISKYTATESPFQAECLALSAWVSAFWVAAAAMLNQTPTNEPPPSIEAVISQLPPPPVKG